MSKNCATCRTTQHATYKPQSITTTRETTRSGKTYTRYHCIRCGRVWDTRDRVQWRPLSIAWSWSTWLWGVRDRHIGYTRDNARLMQRVVYLGMVRLAFGSPPKSYVWKRQREEESA